MERYEGQRQRRNGIFEFEEFSFRQIVDTEFGGGDMNQLAVEEFDLQFFSEEYRRVPDRRSRIIG